MRLIPKTRSVIRNSFNTPRPTSPGILMKGHGILSTRNTKGSVRILGRMAPRMKVNSNRVKGMVKESSLGAMATSMRESSKMMNIMAKVY